MQIKYTEVSYFEFNKIFKYIIALIFIIYVLYVYITDSYSFHIASYLNNLLQSYSIQKNPVILPHNCPPMVLSVDSFCTTFNEGGSGGH